MRSKCEGGSIRIEGNSDKEETVLAFDLGGGTLDLSLMDCKAGHLKVQQDRACVSGGN